jgi:DNA-binding NtrC family response regulator
MIQMYKTSGLKSIQIHFIRISGVILKTIDFYLNFLYVFSAFLTFHITIVSAFVIHMKKKTVLIVEDSPGFSELMKFVVEDEGFRGVVFPLEEDFLQWVDREKPAAIIMDLALNRLSGFDLIQELKDHARHKTIPVIVITGRDLDVKDITQLKMHGIPYLRKGRVDMHEIHQTIRDTVMKTE